MGEGGSGGGVGYVVWVGRGGGRVDWSIGRVVRVGCDFCCRFGDRYARQNINSHIFSTGNDLAISVHRWLLTQGKLWRAAQASATSTWRVTGLLPQTKKMVWIH